jgi:hypothetical protein
MMFRLQRDMANKILMAFQEHPQAWTRADAILEQSASPSSRFFALQVWHSDNSFLRYAHPPLCCRFSRTQSSSDGKRSQTSSVRG